MKAIAWALARGAVTQTGAFPTHKRNIPLLYVLQEHVPAEIDLWNKFSFGVLNVHQRRFRYWLARCPVTIDG